MQIVYPEFAYVDLAIGGVQNRNNVKRFDKIGITAGVVDAYTTLFRFRQEYQDLCVKTGSVRGADKFECWSDFVYFDIDSPNFADALVDAQALIRGLSEFAISKHLQIFFSGKKGLHIGIPSQLFGLEPSVTLPQTMKTVCQSLAALFGIDIDTSIYNSNRLFRLPNTKHSKTGFYKTLLPTNKFLQMSETDVIALAKKQRSIIPVYVLAQKVKSIVALCKFVKEPSSDRGMKREIAWEPPTVSERMQKLKQNAFDFLLSAGVKESCRNNEALLRASEGRKLGLNNQDCLERLLKWNQLNRPPLDESEVKAVVKSAYTGNGYDFGTNTKSLAIARTRAKRQVDDIDIADLLIDKSIDETEQFIRKPRTFAELLTEGFSMEMPETVGEYCSWRGRITLLVGREKISGKSTFCTFEALAALKKGYRVLWVSPDESREDTCYRFQKAGASDYADNLIIAGDMDVPQSLTELITFIRDTKPDLLILDSIHSLVPLINENTIPDSSQTAEWQQFINRLRPAAILLDMAVIWIHHVNKATGTATGSIGITAGVDAILTLTAIGVSSKRKLEFVGRRISSNMNCVIDYLGESQGYIRFDWEDQQEKEEKNETESYSEITTWLLTFLTNAQQPVDSKIIKAEFKKLFPEAAERTLTRAKDKLKIKIKYKTGKELGTVWVLPPKSEINEHDTDFKPPSEWNGDENDGF
jgi:hypothetical protein